MFQTYLRNRKLHRLRNDERDLMDILDYEQGRKASAEKAIADSRQKLAQVKRELYYLTGVVYSRAPMATYVRDVDEVPSRISMSGTRWPKLLGRHR